MVSAKYLWGTVLFGGNLQIDVKNSIFKIFESALCMKSVSMPLSGFAAFFPHLPSPSRWTREEGKAQEAQVLLDERPLPLRVIVHLEGHAGLCSLP